MPKHFIIVLDYGMLKSGIRKSKGNSNLGSIVFDYFIEKDITTRIKICK